MKDFKEKTVRAFMWHGTFRVLTQAITWCITIVLVRILRPEDYGLMGMAMILIGFMDMFNDIGFGAAIVQKKESFLNDKDLSSIFWMGIFLGLTIYIFIFAVSPFAAAFFKEEKLLPIVRFLGIGFIIGGLRLVPYNLLTKALRFKRRGLAEFVSSFASSIACLAAALSGLGVWSLVVGYVLKELILTIMSYSLQPFRPAFYFSWEKIRQLFSFGMNVTLSRILWYFYSNADYLIIGRLLGKVPLGYYSVAFQLSSMPITKVNQLIREVAFPSYSIIQKKEEELRYYFLKNIRLISIVLFPVLVGLCLVANDFVTIVLGEKWTPAIFLFQVLCISGIIKCLASQSPPILNAIGKPQINVRYTLLMTLIMPLTFFIMSRYGIEWVAMSWLVVYPFLAMYVILKTLKELNLSFKQYVRSITEPLIGCLAMILPILLFQSTVTNAVIRLTGCCLLGIIIYPSVLLLISKEASMEIRSIFSLLKQMRAGAA